ncbi:MAG: DUF4190 domain-containing protein [Mycobacteriales bacterium]
MSSSGSPQPYSYSPAPEYPQAPFVPKRYNSRAVVALILSIISLSSLLVLVSPIALVIGYQARAQIRQSGEAGGNFARVSIILGWVGTGLLLFAAAGITTAIIAAN